MSVPRILTSGVACSFTACRRLGELGNDMWSNVWVVPSFLVEGSKTSVYLRSARGTMRCCDWVCQPYRIKTTNTSRRQLRHASVGRIIGGYLGPCISRKNRNQWQYYYGNLGHILRKKFEPVYTCTRIISVPSFNQGRLQVLSYYLIVSYHHPSAAMLLL